MTLICSVYLENVCSLFVLVVLCVVCISRFFNLILCWFKLNVFPSRRRRSKNDGHSIDKIYRIYHAIHLPYSLPLVPVEYCCCYYTQLGWFFYFVSFFFCYFLFFNWFFRFMPLSPFSLTYVLLCVYLLIYRNTHICFIVVFPSIFLFSLSFRLSKCISVLLYAYIYVYV